MNCCICKCDVAEHERDYCATRQTDGEPVCPECTAQVRAGNRDVIDKIHSTRRLSND